MSSATVLLPGQADLARRLRAVDDDPRIVDQFHVKLLPAAGQELSGPGVAVALSLAFEEYRHEQDLPSAVAAALFRQLADYAMAIVDNPVVRRQALQIISAGLPPS
ncbi:hypothetical protein ABZ953_39110 [Streptomyces sp. NPDC046465]|uniref:hypothetical protein n=1 Tax=Streptomyces sp. NPDC046465 TaxID=3155810 RepID=UPI0033E7257B